METFQYSYEEEDTKGPTLTELWEEFTQSTGYHGVNKLSKNKGKVRIVIWWLLIIALTVSFLIILVAEFTHYYSYPTISSTEINRLTEVKFPAVTICNLSNLNKSAILDDARVANFYKMVNPIMQIRKSATTINWSDPFYEDQHFFKEMSIDDLVRESKDIYKTIREASFDNKVLNVRESFTLKLTTDGICFTFNPVEMPTTSYIGSYFNLYMTIFVDYNNSYYGRWLGEGIKFTVHDPNDEPEISNSGHYVETGNECYAKITKTEYQYLERPFKAMPNMYCEPNSDNKNYSYSKCVLDCEARYIYNACMCYDISVEGKSPYCSKYDYLTCVFPKINELLHGKYKESECNCLLPCRFTKYDVTLTTIGFPSEFYAKEIVQLSLDETVESYRKNYIGLHIYFDELKTTVVKQVSRYSSIADVFGNIGGQMGLFIGASLITLTEIVELILFLIWVLMQKIKTRHKVVINKNKQTVNGT